MIERSVEIRTRDGSMPTTIAHPERDGPHPVVVLFMDGMGIRPALRDQAMRLASSGYYAMLPDLYYRAGAAEPVRMGKPGEWERMMERVRSVTSERAVADATALLEVAAKDDAARDGPAGVMGYCMGGRLSVVVAQGLGPRIAAAGAIHPGNLASDADDSPHRHLDRCGAELYLAIADEDQWCTPEQVALMEGALEARGIPHEIEWHRGAQHGFAVPGSAVYHREAAERVWERLHALFARTLR